MLKYTYISQDGLVSFDGEKIEKLEVNRKDFLKKLYKAKNLDYPKFYKMDDLCKLAFLALEYLLTAYKPQDLASLPLVFANKYASLHADLKHVQNMQQGQVSPSVFVYTLPNIAIGEVAIRHKIKGENAFYVMKSFSAQQLLQYASVFEQNEILITWVECTDNEMEVFAFVWDKTKNQTEKIEKLYNTLHGRIN